MSKINEFFGFLGEARQELRKVTWPTKPQTLQSTWIVLIGTIILALILGGFDWIISNLVKAVLN